MLGLKRVRPPLVDVAETDGGPLGYSKYSSKQESRHDSDRREPPFGNWIPNCIEVSRQLSDHLRIASCFTNLEETELIWRLGRAHDQRLHLSDIGFLNSDSKC